MAWLSLLDYEQFPDYEFSVQDYENSCYSKRV
jgi:hypothetical protein